MIKGSGAEAVKLSSSGTIGGFVTGVSMAQLAAHRTTRHLRMFVQCNKSVVCDIGGNWVGQKVDFWSMLGDNAKA